MILKARLFLSLSDEEIVVMIRKAQMAGRRNLHLLRLETRIRGDTIS